MSQLASYEVSAQASEETKAFKAKKTKAKLF